MNYQQELDAALEAARLAGEEILKAYKTLTAQPDAPADITTKTDRDSQEFILSYLHNRFPHDAFLAEEDTPALKLVPRQGSRLWIIDPIDGTRGFARKNGEFSVMIAFREDLTIKVGVVYEPAFNRLTYASKGQGCWKRDGNSPASCHVAATAELGAATLIQSHSGKQGLQADLANKLNPAHIVQTYSAGIKLARVARGEADYYLNTYANFHDWDVCAGDILVTEAGGRVTGFNGEPIAYVSANPGQRDGFLASNGLLHAAVLKTIKSYLANPR